METIYLNTTLRARPRDNVVDFQAYREQRSLLLEGAALPEPALHSEITPEHPDAPVLPLERFTAWADAMASVVLAVGALAVIAMLL